MPATTFEQLIASLELRGVAEAKRGVDSVSRSFRELGGILEHIGTLGGVGFLFSQIDDAMRSLGGATGTTLAAQFGSMEYKLRSLVGTGQQFRNLLRDIRGMGGDPLVLGQTAAQMNAGGVPINSVAGDLSKLRDATAAGGAKPGDLSDILFNILQIRSAQGQRADFADIREMLSRAPGMSRVLAAGLGVRQEDVLGKLRSGMTGSGVYEALLKGASAPGIAGSAQRAEREDPLQAWDAMMRDFRKIMLPTGRLILNAFGAVAPVIRGVAGFVGQLNENSKGLLGLAGILGGGLMIATRLLTSELGRLVIGMTAAAGAARTQAGATAAAGGAALLGPGTTAAAGGAAAGIGARLLGFLGKAVRGLGIAGIVAGLSGMIGGAITGDGKDRQRAMAGNLIGNIGMGAGIGAGIGSLFGPGGAFIGAAIGLIGGLAKTLYDQNAPKGKSEDNRVVGELKKQTQSLDEIKTHFRTWGGGRATSSAVSSFQIEWQIAKALNI